MRSTLSRPRDAGETIAVSGKDDFFNAAALADMGQTCRHQIQELAADSDIAEAVKIAASAHQKLIWERTRHLLRMRSALREYFAAVLEAYADLTVAGADTLELLGKPPDPASAARVTIPQVTAALRRVGRRSDLTERARGIQAALRTPHLAQPDLIAEAYAAAVRESGAVIGILNQQAKTMEAKVSELFHRHSDARVYLSQPGAGDITGARMTGSPSSSRTAASPAGSPPAPCTTRSPRQARFQPRRDHRRHGDRQHIGGIRVIRRLLLRQRFGHRLRPVGHLRRHGDQHHVAGDGEGDDRHHVRRRRHRRPRVRADNRPLRLGRGPSPAP